MTETTERVLDWDDEIEKDGDGFTVLPVGEYPFTVVDFERERFTPKDGGKLPACNMAIVHIKLDGGDLGTATIKDRLYLHSMTEGLLCAFFTGIGQRSHGEKVAMNWDRVNGSTGRAKVGIRKYTKDGKAMEINEINQYLDPGAAVAFTPGVL